jgi:hypothetical protein
MTTWSRKREVTGGIYEDIYSVDVLWELVDSVGVEYRPLSDFKHAFHSKCWSEGGVAVAPCEVVLAPQAYPACYQRIIQTKLTHPLLVTATIEPEIINGLYRLCKAELSKFSMVSVKFVDSPTLERALLSSAFYASV